MVSGGRKLGDSHTLRGDKPGPQLFPVPLSAAHPATAHCPTTRPRPRLLALKPVKSEALTNGAPFLQWLPHSSRKPTNMIAIRSTAMKIPTYSFLSVLWVPPPPGSHMGGSTASPMEQLSKKTDLNVAADSGIAILAQEWWSWNNPFFWLVGQFLDGNSHFSKDCSFPSRTS